MQADSDLANQAVRDPSRYKPDMLRDIEVFNKAVAHFRRNGHSWPKSPIHGTMQTSLHSMASYDQFEEWIFKTQGIYRGTETLPERT